MSWCIKLLWRAYMRRVSLERDLTVLITFEPDQATVEKVGAEGCVDGPNCGSVAPSHLKEKGEDGDDPDETETQTGDPWSPFEENVVDEPEDVD